MSAASEILKLDKASIIRPDYGPTSLKSWEPEYIELIKRLEIIDKYSNKVDNQTNSRVTQTIKTIYDRLNEVTIRDETQYVAEKQNFINQMNQYITEIMQYWPHYAIAAIEASGLLDEVDVKKRFENLLSEVQEQTNNAISKIESESTKIIDNAKKKADEIESSARKTAQKISVQDAQQQFENGAKNNLLNIKIWAGISILLVLIFIVLIIYMLNIKFSDEWTWKVVYYSVIRAAIIGFVATMMAFALKILKSHLHMREHNLHRLRIANSMSAFAESASNKDQRDLILSKLVESVANFGNSGMIENGEDSGSKLTIDNITRTLSAIKPGGN